MSSSVSTGEEEPHWLISVKTVGAESLLGGVSGSGDEVGIPPTFDIRVKPSDNVQSLHHSIENVTGLKESQQRLIYRGRLIQSHQDDDNNNKENDDDEADIHNAAEVSKQREPTKISEIRGLADGHTIHLVRRQDSSASTEQSAVSDRPGGETNNRRSTSRSSPGENDNNFTESSSSSSSSSSTATSSLLAALLGLSALDEETTTVAAEQPPSSSTTTRASWRRGRGGGGGSRPSYRLTAEDLEVPDPGSMESVRQGLMTLHTLLPIAETHHSQHQNHLRNNNNNRSSNVTTTITPTNPLEHQRRWYLGQWIDCRDTVNQWLEATIVDIVRPDEIMPLSSTTPTTSTSTNTNSTTAAAAFQPAMDPAVGAADLEGRRRLLLEPCELGEEGDLGGDWSGFRPRPSNRNALLLLIHYNGWPHRWDEWIRSDSERIRPFRVRTRHPTSSSWVSPITQSHYADSPNTYISGDESNDEQDRAYLLHELLRVTTAVNTLAQRVSEALPTPPPPASSPSPDLPWRSTVTSAGNLDFAAVGEEGTDHARESLSGGAAIGNQEPFVSVAAEAAVVSRFVSSGRPNPSLEMLAPLIDRLGRTLVDAAPHIAFLAASQNNRNDDFLVNSGSLEEEDREENETPSGEVDNTSSNSLGGLLSLLNRDRSRRSSRTSQLTDRALSPASEATNAGAAAASAAVVDLDYMDFASGLVNVSRGDVRSGPRSVSRGGGGGNGGGRDEISGLLGAYLAAASLGGLASLGGDGDDGNSDMQGLGRLFRNQGTNGDNGGGGGGIDIHIHAVVTAPGISPTGGGGGGGGTALALGLGGGILGTPTTMTSPASDLFVSTRRATAQRVRATLMEQNNHHNGGDDMGIFDDLYSENPDPVSPSSSASSTTTTEEGRRINQAVHDNIHASSLPQSPSRRSSRRSSPTNNNNGLNNNNNNNTNQRTWFRLFRRSGSSE